MAEEAFNGEKLTVTKVELGLVAVLALVVASMFIGIEVFILLALVATVVAMVLLVYLTGGKLPGMGGS